MQMPDLFVSWSLCEDAFRGFQKYKTINVSGLKYNNNNLRSVSNNIPSISMQ